MRELGYDPLDSELSGDTPRALGDRIGRAVLDAYALDGANEAGNYADPQEYQVDDAPLSADLPGTVARDPSRWQPLLLSRAISANGIRLGSGVQSYLGAHWGGVSPFAMTRPAPDAPYLELGGSPLALDAARLTAVVDVIARSAQLGVADGCVGTSPQIAPGRLGVLRALCQRSTRSAVRPTPPARCCAATPPAPSSTIGRTDPPTRRPPDTGTCSPTPSPMTRASSDVCSGAARRSTRSLGTCTCT
jgi:hypothetical protein